MRRLLGQWNDMRVSLVSKSSAFFLLQMCCLVGTASYSPYYGYNTIPEAGWFIRKSGWIKSQSFNSERMSMALACPKWETWAVSCCGREEERQDSCVQKIFMCEMLSSRGFLISATKSRQRNSLKDINLLMNWNHCDPKSFQWAHLLELYSVVLASSVTQKKSQALSILWLRTMPCGEHPWGFLVKYWKGKQIRLGKLSLSQCFVHN